MSLNKETKPNLIRKLMHNKFELVHNAAEATKNICTKNDGTVDDKNFAGVART